VIEPDPDLLRMSLLFHDLTGDDSPLAQPRFRWFVGPDWAEQLWAEWEATKFMLPPANITIRQGLSAVEIEKKLGEMTHRMIRLDAEWKAAAERFDAGMDRETLVRAFEGRLDGERPRVLLLTTRFSTVLQYATRDSADGFRQIGWDAQVVIEPEPWHRMTRTSIRQAIAEFKPHLIFQLDHLRAEHGDLIPPRVPFVCWIQDHLPNLTNPAAGKSVTLRDFVLSNCGYRYESEFGYPKRQSIHLSKATRVPPRPATWKRDGEDLVFVSNCSKTPQQLSREILAAIADPAERQAVAAACERLIAHYARGGCIETESDLRDLAPEAGRWLARLWHPLNDTLYRQQSLRWVANVAGRLGLKLALYGNGWADNPEFAPHARGYVKYGEALEDLTRRAKFNLQIMPFSCLHQRLFDGLVAGGFYLIRDNLRNHLPLDLMRFVETHCGDVPDSAAALAAVPEALRAELQSLIDAYRRLNPLVDAVAQLRALRDGGNLQMVPLLEDVAFVDEGTLETQIRRHLADPKLADEIAAEQRAWVERNFTYAAHLGRVVREIAQLIATEGEES
jgi:hypothetical protein